MVILITIHKKRQYQTNHDKDQEITVISFLGIPIIKLIKEKEVVDEVQFSKKPLLYKRCGRSSDMK